MEPEPIVLVIMGVSGSGKSTVAALLACRLGWDFEEGDNLHPPANVAKMAAGHPLDDNDRAPWLARIASWIQARTSAGRPGIITSSALKRAYRDVVRGDHVMFVYLTGSSDLIRSRLIARRGHFMPASLLASQFATLEPPAPPERFIEIDIETGSEIETGQIISELGLVPAGATKTTTQS